MHGHLQPGGPARIHRATRQRKDQILFKWPDQNIRKFSQLTVEADELAVFFRDGRVQGSIQPGRVTLDSSEIPFLGVLVDSSSNGNLFLTELYLISTHEFPNLPFDRAAAPPQ